MKDMRNYIWNFSICLSYKQKKLVFLGLVQPLPILARVFTDITMNFVERLFESHGKSMIPVVVNKLTKYGHFMGMSHPYLVSTIIS